MRLAKNSLFELKFCVSNDLCIRILISYFANYNHTYLMSGCIINEINKNNPFELKFCMGSHLDTRILISNLAKLLCLPYS